MSHLLDGTPLAVIPMATVAALLAGALLPVLGMWVVLQRVVFLGITLSQVAAAGVALGLLLGVPPLPLGFLLCGGLVLLFTRRFRGGVGAGGDSSLGAAFCAASALALLFISRSPGDLDQVEHVLHGNLIFAGRSDVLAMAAALVGGVAVLALFKKQLLFCAFDGETAMALGLHTRGWTVLLFGVLAFVLSLCMRTTGSLLTFALLILPPLAALQFRRGLSATIALAALLGVVGTIGGLLLSVTGDLHLESSIVVAVFLLLPLAWLWRISPLLSLAAVAGLCWLAPQLAPHEAPAPPPAQLAAAASPTAPADPPAPLSIDVHLQPRPGAQPHTTQVDWTLDLHAGEPGRMPRALWLVLTGPEVSAEQPLIADTAALPGGKRQISGAFQIAGDVAAGALDGQVWSGPSASLDSEPLDATVVVVPPR